MATNWDKIRARGPIRFILLYGMLGWGCTVALFWTLVMTGFAGYPFFPSLIIAFAVFPPGGLLWGMAMWWVKERKCQAAETCGT